MAGRVLDGMQEVTTENDSLYVHEAERHLVGSVRILGGGGGGASGDSPLPNIEGTTRDFLFTQRSSTFSKSFVNEVSKLLRAQLNIRFTALKLLSTVAVPTGKVDMVIALNKLRHKSGSMFLPFAIRIFPRSHSVLSKAESIWRQAQNLATRLDKVV